MRISIIIPTLGRREDLERCLAALDGQAGDFEVLVMDQNGPEFGLEAVCAPHRNVTHVLSPVLGLSVNRNLAFARSTGEWILYADDDCVLAPEYLARAARGLEAGAGRGTSSRQIFFTEVRNLEDGAYYTFPLTDDDQTLGYGNFKKIPSIGFIFSRAAVEALRGFDECLGLGARYGSGEDTDILLRALGMGIPVRRLPGCVILHPRQKKSAASLDRCRKYALGYGALFAKHILIQPWRRKPRIIASWMWILASNVGGIVLNLFDGARREYYWNSLVFKGIGYVRYLLRETPGAAAG